MADNRTMAQMLQAPTEGYEDAIVIPEINANFELKHGLINLVQNKQFFGHDKEDPHAHIRYFNKITSTMRFPDVPSTSIKLMLFPFSLEGSARIWLEKEPPRSIMTWDDLVSKFINQFFPPSKTTNLRNEITRFQQRFDESFYEAWDRFNDLLRACPHHGFSELHQLDTFYNALNANDQDSLNSAAGGNFLDKMPRECLRIIESKSKVRNSRNKAVVAKVSSNSSTPGISPDVAALTTEVSELKNLMKTMLIDKQKAQAPATVKAVEQSCVVLIPIKIVQPPMAMFIKTTFKSTFHKLLQPILIKGIPILDLRWLQTKSDLLVFLRFKTIKTVSIQIKEISSTKIEEPISIKTVTSTKGKFSNLQRFNHQFIKLLLNKCKFITSNTASSSNSRTLPSQTVTNPREHVNAITTRSGKTCEGPSTHLPTPVVSTPLKESEQNPETSMEKVQKPKEAEMKKHMEIVQDNEVAIDAIPLATTPPVIVEWKIIKEGKMGYYQLIRADGSSKGYSSMIRILQNIDREDLETLWKLVKAKHGNTRREEGYERVLWGDLKVMFKPDVESEIWRNLQGYKVIVWKLFSSCGVHFVRLQNMHIFMLVEKKYPLTPATITKMLNKKLQTDYWNEILLPVENEENILSSYYCLYTFSAAGTKVNVVGMKVTITERLQLLKEFLLSEG
ncbi:reverse transcriptase domain-containing protein [Tanacetum coccineum]